MKKVTLYAVPDPAKVSGGPRVRISGISEALKKSKNNFIIVGNNFSKLLLSIRLPKTEVLYIESSTNRLALLDLVSLMILRLKSKTVVTYIRDIYIELFPEEYKGFGGGMTKYANRLSSWFYATISDRLAFPTLEMGAEFYNKNSKFPQRKYFSFPPGTFLPDENLNYEISKHLVDIKLLYLGGTKYKHSGFEDFLKVAKQLRGKYEFHILTNDKIDKKLEEAGLNKGDVKLLTVPHSQVMEYIRRENITFAVHSRPRNVYDDITYPIKFMDFISCLLPPLTLKHKPIVSLLGENYPFYIDEFKATAVDQCIEMLKEAPDLFTSVIGKLEKIREEKLYINQVTCFENI